MDRFRVLFFLQLIGVFFFSKEFFGQEVSSVSALQKGNSIEISYELKSDAPCDVQAFVSLNNGKKWIGPLSNVKGDIGDFILAGKKQFEWEVLKSQDDLIGSEIKFKIVATKVDPYKPKMVFVKGGKFQMGSVNGEPFEMPIHEVEVGSFEIGKYEVTQFEWREIMGSNPSHFSNCDNCPVESITWYEAQQFVYRLNLFSVKKYRLPTEAEWEYAASSCVNNCQEIYPGGDDINGLSWNVSNSDLKTHPVGRKLPNQLGVFDLGGNVFEWCEDWSSPYKNSSFILAKEKYRILRGGSWGHDYRCRIKNRDGDEPQARNNHYGLRLVSSKQNYTSNFDLEMVSVEGGTFQMGCEDYSDKEKPIHGVRLNSFNIGKYEVTQAQWKAVMGSNPSYFKDCDQCPVDQVSYNEALLFIKRLNQITGKLYRLPTEAEWEFAAIGGVKSKGFIYSGSNNIDDVAWFDANSVTRTNEVGKKKPNELGIYDMSGNVQEFCVDFLGGYLAEKAVNPFGPLVGSQRIIRGGGYNVNSAFARNSVRNNTYPESAYANLGLRLVLPIFDLKAIEPETVLVEGGTFQMGSNSGEEDEKPVHAVTLSSFKIAKYEVTQAQWKAVMGNNPSQFSTCDQCPVENVSFNDIQEYLKRLNSITGKIYRLPTEAEWEYAARGGKKSKGYQYSGSNDINSIAWVDLNSNGMTQIVGLKKPNELGIFDMSGNVWEWCADLYISYGSNGEMNPKETNTFIQFVLRGGSHSNGANGGRVSDRIYDIPTNRGSNTGFRLVLNSINPK